MQLMPRRLASDWIAATLVLLPAACAEPVDDAFAVADSAGVRIVVNQIVPAAERPIWIIDTQPLVQIGDSETASADLQFDGISAILPLADGDVLIADRSVAGVRRFGPDGTYRWTLGRRGRGPGEFESVSGFTLIPPDTVVVYDRVLARVSELLLDGTVLNTVRLDPAGHTMRLYRLAGMGDGVLLLVPLAYPANRTPAPTLYWDSVPNLAFRRSGEYVGVVGEASGMEIYASPDRSGAPAFGRIAQTALAGSSMVITDGGEFDIRRYHLAGGLEQVVRVALPRRVVTAAERNELPEFLARPHAVVAYKPWISGLVVGPDGELWVEEYQWQRQQQSRWFVLTAEGRWIGSVEVPARFQLTSVLHDRVMGIWRSPWGVEQVHVYPRENRHSRRVDSSSEAPR